MWLKYKWLYLVIVTTVSLSSLMIISEASTTRSSASIENTENLNTTFPKLFATKVTNKAKISLGETIVITITIQNFGNQTAFNVTFIEQNINPWVFEISGLTKLSYRQIEANSTQQFSYLIYPKLTGILTIPPSKIEYYDSDITPYKFIHETNSIAILVEEPLKDFSIDNFNVAITFLLIIIIFDIILIIRLISPKLTHRSKNK